MTGTKPSTYGIVVDHKESGVRYAISDKNYDERVHRKVRNLKPGESVQGYVAKVLSDAAISASDPNTPTGQEKSAKDESGVRNEDAGHTKPEGSAAAGTKEAK